MSRGHRLSLPRPQALRKHADPGALHVSGQLVRAPAGAQTERGAAASAGRARGRPEPAGALRVELAVDADGHEPFLGRAIAARDGSFALTVHVGAEHRGLPLLLKVLDRRPPLSRDEGLERCWEVVARARSGPVDPTLPVRFGEVVVGGANWRRGGRVPRWQPDPDAPRPVLPTDEWYPCAERAAAARRAADATPDDPVAVAAALALPGQGPSLAALAEAWPWGWEGDVLRVPPLAVAPDEGADTPLEITLRDGAPISVRFGGAQPVTPAAPDWAAARARAAARLRVGLWLALAGTHLRLERFAVAAARTLRASPVADALRPALRDVAWINALAEGALFAPTSPVAGVLPWAPPRLGEALAAAVAAPPWGLTAHAAPRTAPHDTPGALARAALRDTLRLHALRALRADERRTADTWHELLAFDEELRRHPMPTSTALVDRAVAIAEPERWPSRPDDGAVEAVADTVADVLTEAFTAGPLRRLVADAVGAVEGRLRLGEEPPEVAVRRLAAAHALRLEPGRAYADDPFGEADPRLVALLSVHAEVLEAGGLPPSSLDGRVRVA